IVVAYWKPAYVLLDLDAQVGDQALRRLAQQLHQRKRRDSLHEHCRADDHHQRLQQLQIALLHHVVDQVLSRAWQHQAGQAVDQYEEEPAAEDSPARPDQLAEGARQALSPDLLLPLLTCRFHCHQERFLNFLRRSWSRRSSLQKGIQNSESRRKTSLLNSGFLSIVNRHSSFVIRNARSMASTS